MSREREGRTGLSSLLLAVVLLLLTGLAGMSSGCATMDDQFQSAITECKGKPLSCFHETFGPTEGNLRIENGLRVYRFDYYMRQLYGHCWGVVVLGTNTGMIEQGYTEGDGCSMMN